ncbi:MAG: YcxB family protein [Armatimonadetes bacterium]|nr:YcxB family protein [Armatimonadota bacterium]
MTDPSATTEITFDVTDSDLLWFNMHRMEQSPLLRRQRRMFTVQIVAGLVMAGAGVFLVTERSTTVLIGYGVAIVLALLFADKYWLWASAGRVRKLLREAPNPTLVGVRTLRLTSDGLDTEYAAGSSRTKWSAVERVETTAGYVLIYVGANMAHIVPRGAFADDAAVAEFASEIEQRRAAA